MWEEEWQIFKQENHKKPWFTEKAYELQVRESSWSSVLNGVRSVIGKDPKTYQSLTQQVCGSTSAEFRDSSWSNFLNSVRTTVGKDEKEFQSLRQTLAKDLVEGRNLFFSFFFNVFCPVKNPNSVQLLIANGQAKMNAMTEEEWNKMMEDRPRSATFQKKFIKISNSQRLVSNLLWASWDR